TLPQAIQRVGFAGMWQGLGARILMIGTLTALQWFIYDSVKISLAMPPVPTAGQPSNQSSKKDNNHNQNKKT
ncbi:unnamed protein product, partial [Adineta steineri]